MKWTVSNIIALVAVIGNIVQILIAWQKNLQDAKHDRTIEENRSSERKQTFELQSKQLELQRENSRLRSDVELKKAELDNQKELNKIKLANQQYSYGKAFPQAQAVFEEFATTTRKVLSSNDFPYSFPKDYDKLLSLVTLYCPSTISNIEDIKLINLPFSSNDSDLSKQEYIANAREEAQAWFYDIIQKASNQLYHRPSKSKL